MSMTLWPNGDAKTNVSQMAETILSEELWSPVYERFGVDGLVAIGAFHSLPHIPRALRPVSWFVRRVDGEIIKCEVEY